MNNHDDRPYNKYGEWVDGTWVPYDDMDEVEEVMSDAEHAAERAAQRADDAWAERGVY